MIFSLLLCFLFSCAWCLCQIMILWYKVHRGIPSLTGFHLECRHNVSIFWSQRLVPSFAECLVALYLALPGFDLECKHKDLLKPAPCAQFFLVPSGLVPSSAWFSSRVQTKGSLNAESLDVLFLMQSLLMKVVECLQVQRKWIKGKFYWKSFRSGFGLTQWQ